MIKVEANENDVNIIEANGDGYTLMAELCCIVKALCSGYCKNEDESEEEIEEMTKKMVLTVAIALKMAENTDWGKKLEDDENADF